MAFAVPDNVIPAPDLATVRRALDVLVLPGRTFEVRALPSRRSYVTNDIDAATEAVRGMAADAGIYYTINPVIPGVSRAAADRDIVSRSLLLIDIDPERPETDSSATEDERLEVGRVAKLVYTEMRGRGAPDPVTVDSGNGVQLLYRIDLPNNDMARATVQATLRELGQRYDTDRVKIDPSVCNASRIARLPGTWNRKGAQTAARPWRMARLLDVPEPFVAIPDDMLRSFVGLADHVPATTGQRLVVPPIKAGGAEAWYRKALENESAKVMLEPPGNRHNTLRAAARTLAGYLHHGAYSEGELVQTLTIAGQRAGLDETDVRGAIAWGVERGQAEPLPMPEYLRDRRRTQIVMSPLQPTEKWAEDPTLIASEVQTTFVRWLWPGRIPIGKLTTLAGWGGLGKSFVTTDLAARVSVGAELPCAGGETTDAGNVLILNSEDDPSDTTVPRLLQAESGVDLNAIRFFKAQHLNTFTLFDLETLNRAFDAMGAVRLVVIDPASAHLGPANDHKNAELRAALMPLALWAMEKHVAVCLVTHVNKPQAGKVEALARVVGSVAWVNAVRSALMFARDPEDRTKRIMASMKSNLGPEPSALRYELVATPGGLARVSWLGTAETTADEALAGIKRQPRGVVAAEWLAERFREHREWASKELIEDGRQHGVSRDALFEAKKLLPIRPRKTVACNGDVVWHWCAEEGWPSCQE